jgi:toxin ParE1/3/4
VAFEDRERICDYIEKRNLRAALEIDELLSAQVTQLEEIPESGRQGRIEGTRELVITNTRT